MRLVTLFVSLCLCTGCFGTEVGNPGLDPDAGVTGVVPVGAGYRLDAFFECLRFHLDDDSFLGLDHLIEPQLYGESYRLDIEVRNECDEAVTLIDWGSTDPRFAVAFETRTLAAGEVSEGHLSITFEAAAPSGSIDQRVAIRIRSGETEDDRVITFLGSVHASCATLAGPSCRARPACSWDEAMVLCR